MGPECQSMEVGQPMASTRVTPTPSITAGAEGEQIEAVASQLVAEKTVRIDRAEQILQEIKSNRITKGAKNAKEK